MRWFDSDFDYVQELVERWNNSRKKLRATYCIIAVILIAAGILIAVFPVSVFALIQYLAAAAVIVVGICHFVAFASMTYHFRDYMLILSGILNILLGLMLFIMPVALTVQVMTFMLAFLLIFSGAEKLILNIILAVVFLALPFVSALALNYILAAYLILTGAALLIEAAGMHKIEW